MNIRQATGADIPQMVGLGRAMVAESPRYAAGGYDSGRVRELLERLMPTGGLWVAAADGELVGHLGAMLAPWWWQPLGALHGSDLFLFIREESRGSSAAVRLIRAVERWAWESGAEDMCIGESSGVEPERTVRMLGSMGYAPSSTGLTKVLTAPMFTVGCGHV